MTKEQAYEKLELPVGTDLQVVRQKFQQMHNDFQVQIDGAFNEGMRQRKEQQLEELKEAYAVLNESRGMDDSASLPRTEKTFDQTGGEAKKQTTQQDSAPKEQQQAPPPPPRPEREQPKEQAPPVYTTPPAKNKSNAGLFIGIAAAVIVILAGFYFLSNRSRSPVPSTATADPHQDSIAWEAALAGNSEATYLHYLKQYPEGIFAQAAKDSLGSIKMASSGTTPSQPQDTPPAQAQPANQQDDAAARKLAEQQARIEQLEREKKEQAAVSKPAEQTIPPANMDANALYQKGDALYNNKNYTESLKFIRPAAEQGHPVAQNRLGWMYDEGLGVQQDKKQAHSWYLKAANQGNANSQYNAGWNYSNGVGVTKNETEAVKWYRKAANQGYPQAQFNLGLMYRRGLGVSTDYAEAIKWYRLAADQGHLDAQYNMGWMHERGYGVPQDESQVVYWYKKAAKQGDKEAIDKLKSRGITEYD